MCSAGPASSKVGLRGGLMEGSRWGGAGRPDLLIDLSQRRDRVPQQHLAEQGAAPQSRSSEQIAKASHGKPKE